MQAGVIEICDFCRVQKPGEILVEAWGGKVHICERCVQLCAERVAEERQCASPC